MGTLPEDAASARWTALRWHGFRCARAQLPHPFDAYARRQALRLALCPVDFWRFVEFGAVLDAYRGEQQVLDLGSPRLLARCLARDHDARVVVADLSPAISGELRVYRRGMGRGSLRGVRCDGTRLPIADQSVEFAYSISVLEHIAGEGDRAALAELARVLTPGGRLVVTVPCAPEHDEIWLDSDIFGAQAQREDGKVFFCRLYDWESARERLGSVPGLELEDARAWTIGDEAGFKAYRKATARPESLSSILAKMRDHRHAERLITPCTPFVSEIQTRGVLALRFRVIA